MKISNNMSRNYECEWYCNQLQPDPVFLICGWLWLHQHVLKLHFLLWQQFAVNVGNILHNLCFWFTHIWNFKKIDGAKDNDCDWPQKQMRCFFQETCLLIFFPLLLLSQWKCKGYTMGLQTFHEPADNCVYQNKA